MNCDILVIGAGLAGLSAAAEISERAPNLKTLLIDAGGAASSEIMGFSAPANPLDSPEVMYRDVMRSGGGESDPPLARALCDRALPELHRLEALGIRFDRTPDGAYDMVPALGTTYPRVAHSGTTTGKQAVRLLGRPALKRRAVDLVVSGGRVAGAVLEDGEPVAAKAVVLAGGGFAGLWKFSTWSKKLRGDALILASRAGARLRNLNRIQFEPTVTKAGFPVITTALHEGAVLRNEAGTPLLRPGEPVPRKRELARMIQREIDSGHTVFYDFSGVAEAAFASRYPEYHQRYGAWPPVFDVRPGAHTTLGGIEIDATAATCVPGLFAAGECVGGIHGRDRLGGNAGLEVLVFGRIAGASAARYAQSVPFAAFPKTFTPPPVAGPEVYAAIADCFDRRLTVLDDPEEFLRAAAELDSLPDFPVTTFAKQVCRG